MGKKRQHELVDESDLHVLDETEHEEPVVKKQKHDENGVADKIDIWLVKKPKNVSNSLLILSSNMSFFRFQLNT